MEGTRDNTNEACNETPDCQSYVLAEAGKNSFCVCVSTQRKVDGKPFKSVRAVNSGNPVIRERIRKDGRGNLEQRVHCVMKAVSGNGGKGEGKGVHKRPRVPCTLQTTMHPTHFTFTNEVHLLVYFTSRGTRLTHLSLHSAARKTRLWYTYKSSSFSPAYFISIRTTDEHSEVCLKLPFAITPG